MSILSSIVGFFTGGSKTADTVMDSVKRAGDMLVFTDEEKSITNQKGMELFIKYQEATLPQNVTRRVMAIVIVVLWAFVVVLTILVGLVGIIGDFANVTNASTFVYGVLKDVITIPFGAIVGFYFLKRMIQK